MAVAAPSAPETKASTSSTSLWVAGLVGGIYVLGALATVCFAVPALWDMGVSPWLIPAAGSFADHFGLGAAVLTAAAILAVFGVNLAGPNPPAGIRGAIFLGISSIITVFFLVRAALMIVERLAKQPELTEVVALAIVGFLSFLFYKFAVSGRFERFAFAIESSGALEPSFYKRNQGLRTRRMTIVGLIVLFGSGIYSMVHNHVVSSNEWSISLPFSKQSLTLLTNAPVVVPVVLALLMLWAAWRLVNIPVFADFLIATEAEINKVSWTPRARLIQDTIVVLVTLLIITVFLFGVDQFWGHLLSSRFVGILPSAAESQSLETGRQVNTNEY